MKRWVVAFVALAAVGAAFWASGAMGYLLSARYLPHRYCYLAQPGLVWANVAMDALIAVSYAWIFGRLMWIAKRLDHITALGRFLWIFVAFALFIVACGGTHVMEVVTVWWPVYRLSAAVKILCAAASLPTAVVFSRIAPVLVTNIELFFKMLSSTEQEKNQAVASLISSEKLAAAGRISAQISHEVKNPLENVGNFLYLLRTDPGLRPDLLPLVESAEHEIQRASEIARNTLSLYRDSADFVLVDLERLLTGVLDLLEPMLRNRSIAFHRRIRCPYPVWAHPGELRQIIINLVQNAAEAIDRDGTIQLRVQPRRSPNGQLGYSIVVADSGPGIAPEDLKRIFGLFFTTKGEHGTGLGLWLVKAIAEKHHGSIRGRSRQREPGKAAGTVFDLWFPLGEDPSPAPVRLPPRQLSVRVQPA